MAQMLTERYRERLHGVLSCYDRIVITGTLPGICYAAGMTSFLNAKAIRIFDYARFAEPLRERIRERAQQLADGQGAQIEFIARPHIRKEDVVAKVLASRGDHPGLVHVISAMEACESYKPWHDKASGKTFLKPDELHRRLDRYAERLCPVGEVFGQAYHWSLMQVEYSTDLIFRSETTLAPLYEQLSRQAVLAVKAEQVARFLGKKISPVLAQEIGSRFATRIEGTCIKHRFGKTGVKMYDKFARILRLETTTNDVSFFKHHRKVEHKNGTETRELAPLKKSIYSLIDLREILLGCNRRYLDFLSSLDDHSDGQRALQKLTEPKTVQNITWRGFNFFAATDQALLRAVLDPKFNIHGLRRADLKPYLPNLSDSSLSRQIKRLRIFGMIKRVSGTYRYYLTKLGRAAIAACVHATEFTILPTLATTA